MQAIKVGAPVDVPLTRASQGHLIRCLLLTNRSWALNIHSQPETRNPLPQISSLPVQYSIYPKIPFPISTVMTFKPVLYRPDHPISGQICSQWWWFLSSSNVLFSWSNAFRCSERSSDRRFIAASRSPCRCSWWRYEKLAAVEGRKGVEWLSIAEKTELCFVGSFG